MLSDAQKTSSDGLVTADPTELLATKLESYISEVRRHSSLVAANESSMSRAIPASELDNYANEARAGLALVGPYLRTELRVLEIGAGLCMLSGFLSANGFDVTALEPGNAGYEQFTKYKQIVASLTPALKLLSIKASELSHDMHGSFDLIFSNNVLEHISDLEPSLLSMSLVLAPGGVMVHTCPNYLFPYEPHYGIPLIPGMPGISRRIFLNEPNHEFDIWNGLNFVTYCDIQRMSRMVGLRATFNKGTLLAAVQRLDADPVFRERHRGFVGTVYHWLNRLRLTSLLRFVPVALATPMAFTLSRFKEEDAC